MDQTKYAIIVAGGSGVRMGSKIPKQFLEMKGKPVIMHTLEAFYRYSPDIQQILVLPDQHIDHWQQITEQHRFDIPITLQSGGDSRFQSVSKGLGLIQTPGLVAIHDGVRPVISRQLIQRSYETAAQHGSAVAAIALRDSIRIMEKDSSRAADRSQYRLVQTPQTFDVNKLKEAYQLGEQDHFTDDASVWEAAGNHVTLYQGDNQNIKITTFHDLVLAEVLLKFI